MNRLIPVAQDREVLVYTQIGHCWRTSLYTDYSGLADAMCSLIIG
jgi:hypothetical protein